MLHMAYWGMLFQPTLLDTKAGINCLKVKVKHHKQQYFQSQNIAASLAHKQEFHHNLHNHGLFLTFLFLAFFSL